MASVQIQFPRASASPTLAYAMILEPGKSARRTFTWSAVSGAATQLTPIAIASATSPAASAIGSPERRNPGGPCDFVQTLNPTSLEIVTGCRVEPSLADAQPLHRVQFERLGYFCLDPDSDDQRLVFNRTIALKDTWAKIAKKQAAGVGK